MITQYILHKMKTKGSLLLRRIQNILVVIRYVDKKRAAFDNYLLVFQSVDTYNDIYVLYMYVTAFDNIDEQEKLIYM